VLLIAQWGVYRILLDFRLVKPKTHGISSPTCPSTTIIESGCPPLVPTGRQRTFWTFLKQAQLRHIGDVTVILSRRRRNDSPKQTKLLVTNLPMATARIGVAIYLRRWPVEICFKELKSGLDLGQAQVTKDAARVERSVAVAHDVSGSAVLASQAYQARSRMEHLRAQAEIRVGHRRPTDQTHHSTRNSKEIKKFKLAA
jgi:hypothetical protein